MNQDSGIPLTQLQVDGGMTSNRLLMQLQADILCIPVGEIYLLLFVSAPLLKRFELNHVKKMRKMPRKRLNVDKILGKG